MAELNTAAQRFETLLRAVKPEDVTRPVAGLEWNVGEVAAHVLGRTGDARVEIIV